MKPFIVLGAAAAVAAILAVAPAVARAAVPDRLAALEARLADLEAREQIREMFSRYGFTADTGDAKGWSEVWAKDAVYDSANGQMSGRETFFKSIADPNGVHKQQIEGKGSLHTTGQLMIRVDGAKAWAEGPTLVWVRTDDGGYKIFTLSYNHWDLRKADGRWEIVRRMSRPVAPKNSGQVYTAWRTAQ
jgi:hypothetical protein